MRVSNLILSSLAVGLFAGHSGAQQNFGPWVHDTTAALQSFFVAPNGLTTASGLSPTDPWPLDFAVQQADFWLSIFYPLNGSGVTLNLLPGTYTLSTPLSVPAFGLSLEAYYQDPGQSVVIQPPFGGFSSQGTIEIDHVLGAFASEVIDSTEGVPPTILRGLDITTNTGAYSLLIDPSKNGVPANWTTPSRVGVNQCRVYGATGDGIRIRTTTPGAPMHQNEIVDNQFSGLRWGITVEEGAMGSDLIRSNRMQNMFRGIQSRVAGKESADVHPRILSNSIAGIYGDFGIYVQATSARIVNNSIAHVRSNLALGVNPASIRVEAGDASQEVVLANNILYSPAYVSTPGGIAINPDEVFLTSVPATLILEANDYDNSGPLTNLLIPISITNTPIGNPQFVQSFSPWDLHLTPASLSVVGFGDIGFVAPGAATTLTVNGQSVDANCNTDMDLDARVGSWSPASGEVVFRGADQVVEGNVRLSTSLAPLSGSSVLTVADRFGNVRPDNGVLKVATQVDAPVGSVVAIGFSTLQGMGPELQHALVPGFGSVTIDLNPATSAIVTVTNPVTTANPFLFELNFGAALPSFNEGEIYMQAIVLLPNSTFALSNRVRLDIEGIN